MTFTLTPPHLQGRHDVMWFYSLPPTLNTFSHIPHSITHLLSLPQQCASQHCFILSLPNCHKAKQNKTKKAFFFEETVALNSECKIWGSLGIHFELQMVAMGPCSYIRLALQVAPHCSTKRGEPGLASAQLPWRCSLVSC